MMELIFALVILIGVIFVLRLFGAWMLRIDEVIEKLELIRQLLDRSSKKESEQSYNQGTYQITPFEFCK